jgi:S-adenosylmethionine:tRNA ribosyltransferase-isomerase
MNNAETDFVFDLPVELIAQDPAERRGDSRLLLVEPEKGVTGESVFRQLPHLLRKGDLLVMNESRVLPARMITRRVDTGGQVEILLVRPMEDQPLTWLAMARPAKRLRQGICLKVVSGHEDQESSATLEVVAKRDDGQILVSCDDDLASVAEQWGEMPLPPYIRRDHDDPDIDQRRERDRLRYQTVFCQPDNSGAGSVAAPTAGLHFSPETMTGLEAAGIKTAMVRLHVGPGTFRPPTDEQISSRRLHREYFHLPAETARAMAETRLQGGRVIAVGTTSLRVLETVARLPLDPASANTMTFAGNETDAHGMFTGEARRHGDYWDTSGSTRLFISPPDNVNAADGLLTNFHLPGSSLLMLVASLMGDKTWLGVYKHAVENRLRFYSYGDCMLILPDLSKVQGADGGSVS